MGATFNTSLPHRGAHDVGSVLGHSGEEVYVPRALWTETHDSPLKKRTVEFDPKQYAEDVMKEHQRQGFMRQYLVQELGKQAKHSATAKQSLLEGKREFARASFSDVQRVLQSQVIERDAAEESKKAQRAALDEMCQASQQRERENQMREMHEAAEIKLRTVQQLCEEMEEQSRRKKAAQRDAHDAMKQLEAKKQRQQVEKQREVDETRRHIQQETLRAEYQLIAQQERLRAAQEKQDLSYQAFTSTAAQAEAQRRESEDRRLERDVKRHQALSDLHYSRREAARDRQQQRIVETLHRQVEGNKRDRALLELQKQAELDAVNASAERSFEQEIRKFHAKRREELQLQSELVEMMAQKQQKARSEGLKAPPAATTMQVTPAMVEDARRRVSPGLGKASSTPDLHQRLDASRYLAKPCGRPEARGGAGAPPGVGPGDARAAPAAAGGQGQLLPKTAFLASRDRQISAAWHEGLTASDRRIGRQAAAKRGAAAAADKAEAP